jgi:hypothetical protein
MKAHILSIGSYGKIGLPQVIGVNHWIVIILLALLSMSLFRFFESKNL